VRTKTIDLRVNPQAQYIDVPILVAGNNVDRMTTAAAAVLRHLPLSCTGLDCRDDAVSQVLMDIEAFFAHVVSPLLAALALPATEETEREGHRTRRARLREGLPLAADGNVRQVSRMERSARASIELEGSIDFQADTAQARFAM
jgi:hypothetical protein